MPHADAQSVTVENLLTQIEALKVQINELQAQVNAIRGQTTISPVEIPNPVPPAPCYTFSRFLRLGDTGNDVEALQDALRKEGAYNGDINGNFNTATFNGVVQFQEKYQNNVLGPFGLTNGTGFVGRTTTTQLNQLYGCRKMGDHPTPVPTASPSITVTYPTSGETLQKGSNTYINLKFSPSVPLGGFVVNLIRSDIDVAVAHLKFCGTANDYIKDNVIPPNVSWQWKVGYAADGKEIPNGSYRVLVYDCGSKVDSIWTGDTAQAKSGIFSIVSSSITQPSIRVLSPNGGEKIAKDDLYTVKWKSSGDIPNVDIAVTELSFGSSGLANIAKNVPNTGTYVWDLSTTKFSYGRDLLEGDMYKLQVVGTGTDIWDASDNYFSIVASSTASYSAPEMVYPVDGQVLNYGYPHGYMFKVKPVAGASGYLFGFFQDGVMVYENWRDDKTLSKSGEFAIWPSNPFYPKIQAGDLQVWVRVWINSQWSEARVINIKLVSPTAAKPLIDVMSPRESTVWTAGARQTVQWRIENFAPRVIDLIELEDAVRTKRWPLAYNAPNDITQPNYNYIVRVPYGIEGSFRIVLHAQHDGRMIRGESPLFRVAPSPFPTPVPSPSITVLSPNGGEKLIEGETYEITYKATGTGTVGISIMDYEDYQYGMAVWIASVPASQGRYSWKVAQVAIPGYTIFPGDKYKILINSSETLDYSDNYFSIVANGDTNLLPDLAAPQGFVRVYSGQDNQNTFVMMFTMQNQGDAVASPAVYSYISQADGFSKIHEWNTCTGSTVLQPGKSCVSAYTFTFPTAGPKELIVRLDPANKVQESDENNNLIRTVVTVPNGE